MDKKQFKKIIGEILIEYGFTRVGKYFYLDLKEVYIAMAVLSRYEYVYSLSYNFSLKAIHKESDRIAGDIFDAYDSLLIDTVSKKGKKFFEIENVERTELEKDVKERLVRYIDPFRDNSIKHILKEVKNSKRRKHGDNIILTKDIKRFLDLR